MQLFYSSTSVSQYAEFSAFLYYQLFEIGII